MATDVHCSQVLRAASIGAMSKSFEGLVSLREVV